MAIEVDDAARRPTARHRRRARARPRRGASRSSAPTRCGSPRCPARRRPRWSRTCPTTSPSPCCCTCSRCCPSSSAVWSWCRPRSPTGWPRAPGSKHLRRAVGQGRLVRRRPPRRRRRAQRLLARAQRRLRAWSPGPAASRPTTTATREQVFAVVDAAFAQRRKVLRGALRDLAGSAEAAEAALRQAGVDPTARGESLDVDRTSPASPRACPRVSRHEHHRARAREDQPPPRRRGARAATASTRWPRSTRPSGSTTTSPPRPRRAGRSASACPDWIDPDAVPADRRQPRRPRRRAARRAPRRRQARPV